MNVSSLVDCVVSDAAAEMRKKHRCWTPEEEEILRDRLGEWTIEEIGEYIGRSPAAVKDRQVRMMVPSISKRPDWYTGQQAARILSVDIHCIMKLVKRGILPCRILPGPRHIIHIRQVTLFRWAVNPENWIYFRTRRVTHPRLRRLLEIKASQWNDEWLRSGQAAEYYGMASSKCVNAAIHRGRLPAKKWGNWWIKRSDVQAYRFYPGKGKTTGKNWSPRADEFILRARASGMQFTVMARMMKWDVKRVSYRFSQLKKGAT